MRIFLMILAFTCVATVTIFGFRGKLSRRPPLEVFPDMDRQARFSEQGSNTFFADGRDDRLPPAGVVARGNFLEYDRVFDPDFSDPEIGDTALLAGKNADGSWHRGFPVEISHDLMALGREKYEIFCANCHGLAGDGRGVTAPYGVLAANYHTDAYREMAEGEIFNTIIHGKGTMYGLGDRLSPRESWAVILYVRALQYSQNAPAAEVPQSERARLGL